MHYEVVCIYRIPVIVHIIRYIPFIHSLHIDVHTLTVLVLCSTSQALFNRLVPSVNGIRKFSPIQISRLRVSINSAVPESVVFLPTKTLALFEERHLCPLGGLSELILKLSIFPCYYCLS